MMDVVELTMFDVILIIINFALVLLRLHVLEKKVKALEERE